MDALLGPFVDPGSRTFWAGLLVSVPVAVAVHLGGGHASLTALLRALRHRSTGLDLQLYVARRLLGLLLAGTGLLGSFALATHGVRWLDATLGRPELALAPGLVTALYALSLFVAWDASRFAVHWAMHRVPALWAFHQVHHSAEVLTPLTFHRIHPVESLLYGLRGLLVTSALATAFFWLFREAAVDWTLLGVHGIGFALNTATGNLRHSEVWLRFGPLERWLISPAQHQIHHGLGTDDKNYGTWLAIWDRLAGSLALAGPEPVPAFGLPPEVRNHGDDLLSAWFGPVVELLGRARRAPVAAALLLVPALGRAEPPSDDAPAPEADPAPEQADEPADRPEPPALPGPTVETTDLPVVSPSGPEPEAPREFLRRIPAGYNQGEDAPAEQPATPRPEPEPASEPEVVWTGEDILVYAPDGTPRVAGSAHEVDAETLEAWEYDDIERVVTAVPGITTRGEDGFGLRPNIGIRGVNSDRSAKITLLEDGVPLVPAPYAAPAAYYFPMATRMVGVEVFKGPAATSHGPQTVGGAINLRTRDPVTDGVDGELDLAAGMRGTYRAHAWASAGKHGHGLLAEVVHLQTRGFKELDGGGNTGFERTEAMLKGAALPAEGHRLELKLGYAREDSRETYLGLTHADWQDSPYRRYAASQRGHMRWHRTQAELSWSAELGAVRLHTVGYHHFLTRDWTKFNRFAGGIDTHDLLQADPSGGTGAAYLAILEGEADSLTPEQTLLIGTNHRQFHAFGVQTRGEWAVYGDGFASTLRFGLRVHGDRVRRVHTEDPFAMQGGELVATGGDTLVELDSLSSADALAVHAQEELELGRLHLLPGSRVEVIQTSRADEGAEHKPPLLRAELLPGMGALVELTDGLDLFAGVHKGFSPVAPGQPAEVRPEVSWNSELGVRAQRGDLHGELTGYVNDYLNLTGQCTISGGCEGDLVDQQFNGGRALVAGLEAVAGHTWLLPGAWSLPVEGTYTFTHARFRSSFTSGFPQFGSVSAGDGLPYVPTHSGSGRIALSSPRVRLGLGATARSGMRDQAGSGELTEEDVPALVLLDANAEAQLTPELAVYATGTNLTGATAITSWRPFGARPTAPLQVMVGLELAPRAK